MASITAVPRTRYKVAKTTAELLKWIKTLKLGLHKEHWIMLSKQPQPKGQCLNLLLDCNYEKSITNIGYTVNMGSTEGTFKVLSDHAERIRTLEKILVSPPSLGSDVNMGGNAMDIPSGAPVTEL